MNELPVASDSQIEQMHKIAEKKTIEFPPLVEEQVAAESVVEESSAPEPEPTVEESGTAQAAPEPAKPESSKETNLRILRERAEKAEREKEQLMRFVSERVNAQQPQSADAKAMAGRAAEVEEDLDFTIAPDELAEGKHLAKLNKKIKQLEHKISQGAQQSFAMSTEARLKANYPDFEKVVSQSNVASLSELYPEMAKAIGESSDLYNKAVSAYTMIKKLGIHEDETFVQEKAKVQANAVKPRPLASLSPQQGESPLSKANAFANGLTPELQKQLWKETKDAMNNG